MGSEKREKFYSKSFNICLRLCQRKKALHISVPIHTRIRWSKSTRQRFGSSQLGHTIQIGM